MTRILNFALVALAVVVFSMLATTSANAQYPPTPQTVVLAASSPSVTAGGSVSIAALARDASGSPVANVSCTFVVAAQPGTDAAVGPTTATTNSNGIATTTLSVGSTPGTIAVRADCNNGASSTISVVASAAAAPVSPPASLPSSGSAAEGGSAGPNVFVLAGLILMLSTGGLGLFYAAHRVRR